MSVTGSLVISTILHAFEPMKIVSRKPMPCVPIIMPSAPISSARLTIAGAISPKLTSVVTETPCAAAFFFGGFHDPFAALPGRLFQLRFGVISVCPVSIGIFLANMENMKRCAELFRQRNRVQNSSIGVNGSIDGHKYLFHNNLRSLI